jgi:hypothetical protein
MAAATILVVYVRLHCYFHTILANHNSALQFNQPDSQAESRLFFPKRQYSEPLQQFYIQATLQPEVLVVEKRGGGLCSFYDWMLKQKPRKGVMGS